MSQISEEDSLAVDLASLSFEDSEIDHATEDLALSSLVECQTDSIGDEQGELGPAESRSTVVGSEGRMTSSKAPLLSTIYDGKPLSFAELVRSLENYIEGNAADQFQPLLSFCGTQKFGQLTGPSSGKGEDTDSAAKLSEPIALRHIHSTPLVHRPSILDDEDEDEPPPIGLEILSRSRSTPLSTSANSAFGTILRPQLPHTSGPDDRSAFTMRPYRLKPSLSNESPRNTIFNPIRYDNELESIEHTSIEVMDFPPRKEELELKEKGLKPQGIASKTASRAARFLSDVRNLRRKRRTRCGRENPARPMTGEDPGKELKIGDEETISSKSSGNSSDCKVRSETLTEERGMGSGICSETPNAGSGIEGSTDVAINDNSPTTIPSSLDHSIEDDTEGNQVGRVRIQVSNTTRGSILLGNERSLNQVSSPDPSQLGHDASTLTPQSHDSPETWRSSGASYTSGHTTQVTATTFSSGHATTFSSGQVSYLSAISETDLEVMEANKSSKLLEEEDDITQTVGSRIERSDVSIHPHYPGYIELSNSPAALREGANVPAERFFTLADSPTDKRSLGGRPRTSSSLKRSTMSQSPNTISSSSMTTNSSASSTNEEPPTFVSYLDRKITSDLTSLRETDECSSPRTGGNDSDRRESSPSELVGYADVTFEEAAAPGLKAKPRPIWPSKGFQFGRKVRSLPPRSPHRGMKGSSTPPPRGGVSPVFNAVSPPRQIVDHRIDQNVSRPYVLRSTPASTRLLPSQKVSPEILSSSGNVDYAHIPDLGVDHGAYEVVRMGTDYDLSRNYYVAHPRGSSPTALRRTYNEHSIEILKTDSKEEQNSLFVAPEKNASN